LNNTLALQILLYGSENWTVKSKVKSRLIAAEIRFMRKAEKYTWSDHKTNEEILTDLKVTSILIKSKGYKNYWINM
jgi:hypothetical protein